SQVRLGLPGGNDQPRMLPEGAQGGCAGVIRNDAMHAPKSEHSGLRAAAAPDELRALLSRPHRWKRQARLPVTNLPRQFPHLSMNEEARIPARQRVDHLRFLLLVT